MKSDVTELRGASTSNDGATDSALRTSGLRQDDGDRPCPRAFARPTSSLCSVRSFAPKNSFDGKEVILLIDGHSERVRNRTITCAATICCHCGLDAVRAQTPFAFHGTRPRRFLVLVGPYVCKVAALLARWRCPHCRRTFTDYPPFACAHKAYAVPQMTDRAAKYISDPSTSYRKGVCSGNLPIFYSKSPSDERDLLGRTDADPSLAAMAHTSLFRWVTTLGWNSQWQPSAVPVNFTPASHKYTSEQRRSILIACRAACSVLLSDQTSAC